jgi:hypothetical protein
MQATMFIRNFYKKSIHLITFNFIKHSIKFSIPNGVIG